MGAGTVSGGKSAGENEDGGYERNGRCGTNRGGKLADQPVDHIERVLHAHACYRRVGVGDGAQYLALLACGCGGVGECGKPGMWCATEGIG
ncbi:hypothetical protein D3C87_1549330 [compost metagenome]